MTTEHEAHCTYFGMLVSVIILQAMGSNAHRSGPWAWWTE
ncbi:MAG: hypothetical protein AVDCRST_MAG89-5028 [uncultured Gemmatimonadetes bacterium]|uniref:Uncharacterized protein n=1 Tax=uncultured Gemmatimonadota bacterium TaxID=203437 RepID=A0A6J4N2L3_9BACT|nr:MAG: hypothetical protein AVDCRST_MAG89-5028 [uncultured Gemmatimonadota bacterium]